MSQNRSGFLLIEGRRQLQRWSFCQFKCVSIGFASYSVISSSNQRNEIPACQNNLVPVGRFLLPKDF